MSKYLKHPNGLIVKWQRDNPDGYFTGMVMRGGGSGWAAKMISNKFNIENYKPYEPTPQELIEWGETATLTNDNPNKVEVPDKDINLRLECLKLALQYQISNPLIGAQEFYDWITTNQTS